MDEHLTGTTITIADRPYPGPGDVIVRHADHVWWSGSAGSLMRAIDRDESRELVVRVDTAANTVTVREFHWWLYPYRWWLLAKSRRQK
jgi:hypothetical protein